MNALQVMIREHEQITRMLHIMRKACLKILEGQTVPYEDFDQMVMFIKNYADAHHHGKEEKYLFKAMEAQLGPLGQKLIRNGMLVEHDLGRLYISQLKDALERVKAGDEESKLDVIGNSIAYGDLLKRHITKENEVVYTFAESKLPKEVLEEVNRQTEQLEQEASRQGIQTYYENLLVALEEKY